MAIAYLITEKQCCFIGINNEEILANEILSVNLQWSSLRPLYSGGKIYA